MKKIVIVIRGCLIAVTPSQAKEFRELEKEAIRKDWNNNQLP